ncbi:MAG: Three-deoxy-D-manno-octulosonic-acid transferase domain protein [candidate division TM6 bacterium GW2011_GWF2_37_49]|nr:MAG: Three-deoxy-D-manno-octulosonic-acid transferase domain protein [candidate division TM6 bacterium GW2011_GWF2_37_49]
MLILPIFVFYLIYRIFKGKDILGNLWQRLGFVPRTTHKKKIIWLHAVSVGEVLSIQNLINDIKSNNPSSLCYVTVGTITGRQMAEKSLNADYISFMPYDFLPCMLLAFWRIRPSSIIVVEAEIWPNFLIISSWLKISKTLINARISTRSYKRYKSLKFFFSPIFNSFQNILTQSDADTNRFVKIGVHHNTLSTLGNIKAYNVIQKKHSSHNTKLHYTTLLVGSAHSGELDLYLKLFSELKKFDATLRLIIAPRHLTWQQELEDKIKSTNLSYTLWTQQNNIVKSGQNIAQALDNNFKNYDIICLCKLGELFNLYQFTDIFYLGGTFVNIGGHNLLEPAAWSNPCIIGPHHQNTKNNADEMEHSGGLIKVKNYKELKSASQKLLADPELRLTMGNANLQWISEIANKIKTQITNLILNDFK